LLPSFTWNLDPVAVKFPPFALQPVALVLGALGGLSALLAWRKARRGIDDKGGVSFGIMILVAGVMAALVWPDAHPSIELRYYSLLFVVVFLVGYAFLNWQIRRGGGGVDEAGDFIVYGVVGVLAGARLGHVLFYDLEKAMDDPIWIFKIWTGGLSSHGATVGLIIAMYLFTKVRHIPFLEGSDRFSFSAATGATLVRIGNFFNSEIVGRETHADWGVRFPRYDCPPVKGPDCVAPLRYPTQLFEGGLALFTLIVLLVADRVMGKEKRPRGALISLFFAVYFTGRLGVEFTKEYQVAALEGSFTMGQYLSLVPALLGWWGLWWSYKKKLPVGWQPAEEVEEDEEDEDEEEEGRSRRLYDPDVEEVFGGRRGMRPERKRRRRTAEERGRPDDEEQAEDEEGEKKAEATEAPAEEPPPRRRKKRHKRRKAEAEEPPAKQPPDDEEDEDDD
jgi:phosphatidylglycerol:prolipoprotein diacylglycerol transferase